MSEKTVWGIHAGRFSEADDVFMKQQKIALGWSIIPDLKSISPTRDAFKQAVIHAYPESKPGALPVLAGTLFRFVYEMKVGDLVAYPSKRDRKIHLGEVTGDYEHVPNLVVGFPHQRSVKWLRAVDRVRFSQGALYEIGSAVTLFQIKNYTEEFLSITSSQIAETVPVEVDSGPIADDMEEITKDYIIKKLSTEMKGFPLEEFIAHLLEKMGYRARISEHGGDEGIDIIAHRDELGFEPPIIKVQVKSRNDTVKQDEVAALFGRLAGVNEVGLFVTLSTFAAQARSFAKTKEKLRLIDGAELVKLIFVHYDEFDAKYKAILPLRRVFIPDPEEEVRFF